MQADPWSAARGAAERAGVTIRQLTTLKSADDILRVMVATWGEHQLLPREIIRAFQTSGNVPLGAFDGDEMIGYVLGFLGARDGSVQLHSHMLAIAPPRRSAGVGHALKLAQRAHALEAGVRVARWTFDPLQARNAYFNLVKLGAVADGFNRDHYGEMTDILNRGDRSDRLEARWDLDVDRQPSAERPAQVLLARAGTSEEPRPKRADEPVSPSGATIEIPSDYAALKARLPEAAAEWREAVAEALADCIGAGLVATSFLREGAYILQEEPAA